MKQILLVLRHDKIMLFHAEEIDGALHYEAERFWADYFLQMPNGKGDLSPLIKRLRNWQSLGGKKAGRWRTAILIWPAAENLAELVLNKLSHITLPLCGDDDNIWKAEEIQTFFREHTEFSSISIDNGIIKTGQADIRLTALHGKCKVQGTDALTPANLPRRIKPSEPSMVVHLDWDKPIKEKVEPICSEDSRVVALLRYLETGRKS